MGRPARAVPRSTLPAMGYLSSGQFPANLLPTGATAAVSQLPTQGELDPMVLNNARLTALESQHYATSQTGSHHAEMQGGNTPRSAQQPRYVLYPHSGGEVSGLAAS